MDFSSVCLDTMLGGSSGSSNSGGNHGQLKHLRSDFDLEPRDPQDWRSSSLKMARTESYIPSLMRANSSSVMSEPGNNSGADLLESADQATARLLRSDSIVSPFSNNNSNKSLSLPFYHHGGTAYQYPAAHHKSNVAGGMHGMGRLSPFTASQWQELEQQASIFRYIMAGVQVPPELVISMRKTSNMNVNLFSNLAGSLRPNLGWSSFHLGFGSNADPEPGRCRRTDGKKWRCSRDAVPDQKYCERHMNRGRHRSRKPVEGQTQTQTPPATTTGGAAAAISSSTSLATAAAAAAVAARSAVTPNTNNNNNGNTSSFSNLRPQSQLKPYSSATPFQIPLDVDRYLFESPSTFSDSAWRSSRIAPPKPTTATATATTTTNLMGYETRTLVDDAPDFALGHMNLLPLRREDSNHDERRGGGAAAIRHFFDDWPLRSAVGAAPTTTTAAATATNLSISIPSDFSPSSPNNKLTLSPLKLATSRSDELGVDVALGVGMGLAIESDHRHRQQTHNCWIPIAWESPVGGPLGGPLAEVLNSAALPHEKNNNATSVLNLMTGDATWDCSSSGSPRGDRSPTGVLQKTLGSLSDNSSTGSSPRAVKTGSSLCENLRTAAFAQL